MKVKGKYGEPWKGGKYGSGYGNKNAVPIYGDGNQVASAEYLGGTAVAEENAARIVACVNACTGITDPVEAVEKARDALTAFAFRISERIGDEDLDDDYEIQATVPMREVRAVRKALAALKVS